jgi:hypothetical protein
MLAMNETPTHPEGADMNFDAERDAFARMLAESGISNADFHSAMAEFDRDNEPDRIMNCDICGLDQRVVRTSIAEAHRDPTEVYHLACGHAVI